MNMILILHFLELKKNRNTHQDFEITTNAKLLAFKEAAIRRDFTINAIGYDYFKKSF